MNILFNSKVVKIQYLNVEGEFIRTGFVVGENAYEQVLIPINWFDQAGNLYLLAYQYVLLEGGLFFGGSLHTEA